GRELLLLVLQPAERLGAVFIERPIAAGGCIGLPLRAAAPEALPSGPRRWAALLIPTALLRIPATLLMPAAPAAASPIAHALAPYAEEQKGETDWPPEDEAQNHDRDPQRLHRVPRAPAVPSGLVPARSWSPRRWRRPGAAVGTIIRRA